MSVNELDKAADVGMDPRGVVDDEELKALAGATSGCDIYTREDDDCHVEVGSGGPYRFQYVKEEYDYPEHRYSCWEWF